MYLGIRGEQSPQWPKQASATSQLLPIASIALGRLWSSGRINHSGGSLLQAMNECLYRLRGPGMQCRTSWDSGPELVNNYQARLDEISFPYQISYIRWAGHGDNAIPDPDICEFVKQWNEEYEWPRLSISTTSEAFAAFEKEYGHQLPEFKGDLTPYWEDGAGSSALETRMNREASERLAQAATLSAILAPQAYKKSDFDAAWRNVLLYSEHTWGAWNSVSDSEIPLWHNNGTLNVNSQLTPRMNQRSSSTECSPHTEATATAQT